MAEQSLVQVDVVSAEGEVYSGKARMVFAPAQMGDVGITPRHAPLLTKLKPGHVRIDTDDGESEDIFVSGGILEIQPHLVTVLTDTALRAEDLDEAEAQKAKQRAEEAMAHAQSDFDLAQAQSELAEAAARLHMIDKVRNRPG